MGSRAAATRLASAWPLWIHQGSRYLMLWQLDELSPARRSSQSKTCRRPLLSLDDVIGQ